MELRHLRYFVAVAEEMNIHRAAARLNISQPPLSLTIKQLEEEIGVELFSREGRGIKITRAGEAYLLHAKQILADSARAVSDVLSIGKGITGTLKINFVGSSATGILQNTIAAYKKKYPNVALQLQQSNTHKIPSSVLSRKCDIGILRLPEKLPAGVKIGKAVQEDWYLALPKGHRFISQKSISVNQLKDEKLIFYPRNDNPDSYDDVMKMFASRNIVPQIYQEADEQMVIAGLVASGMGIGLVPECMSRIRIDGVVHRPLRDAKTKTGFWFVHRDGEGDVLVKNFLKEVP